MIRVDAWGVRRAFAGDTDVGSLAEAEPVEVLTPQPGSGGTGGELPADFVGVTGPGGEVIDDTAYFRHCAIEQYQRKAREWFHHQQQEKSHAER